MIRAQHPVRFAHRLVPSAAPVSDRLILIGGSDRKERWEKPVHQKMLFGIGCPRNLGD